MKIISTLLTCGLALTLGSCGMCKKTSDANGSGNSIYDSKWKLIELDGKAVADKINGKEPYILFDQTTKRFSASGGCNGLGGSFEMKDKQHISFSQGLSTMMACENMDIERGLSKIFGQTIKYNIDKGVLSLQNSGNTLLAKFTASTNDEKAKLAGKWELDFLAVPGETFGDLFKESKPTISFDSNTGKVTGNGSCNNYSATFKTDGRTLNVGPVASTRMACPSLKGESLFFENLQKINTYSVSGNQLTLIIGDIATMRFKKVK